MSDFPHQILKIERELMRLVDLVSKMEARVALSDQHNSALWYDRAGCQAPSSFVLTASPASPQNSGVSITFTATIVGTTYVPTGTVQFMDGASNLGSPVALVGGVATFATSSLSVATHTINAVYSGDGQYCAGTQSISYQITGGFNPCAGGFTSGTYHITDPSVFGSAGTIPIPLNTSGVGNAAHTFVLGTPGYGSCAGTGTSTTASWTTSCPGGGSSNPLLVVKWCSDNTTGCVGAGTPPACAGGTSQTSMNCTFSSGTSTSMVFTIPSGLPANSPYNAFMGQTITIS